MDVPFQAGPERKAYALPSTKRNSARNTASPFSSRSVKPTSDTAAPGLISAICHACMRVSGRELNLPKPVAPARHDGLCQ